ncbi:MAG TPA: outer membrane beta-barrel protein [Verrucomicrobiae bacterium]
MNVKMWTLLKHLASGLLLAGGMLAATRVTGADVIMSAPPTDTTPPAMQEDLLNNIMNVFAPFGTSSGNTLPEPFKFGPVTVRPHFNYSFLYGSGVQSSANSGQNTIIQTFSPGMTVNLGTHWTLDYTPSLQFYSNRQFHNTVNHSATLVGGTHYEDWTFGLSQSFSKSDSPLVETAAQTEQEQYGSALTASRSFNDKMSADLALNQNIISVRSLQTSRDWSTLDWLNYQFWPRLNAGIGVGGGYVNISDSSSGTTNLSQNNPDQTYEQLQLRINWRATDKISIALGGGFDDRQFMASGIGDSLNPIYNASIQYEPFKHTQISFSAGRTVSASDYYILSQSSEITTIGLNLNQRLLERYNLNLGVGYSETKYDVSLGPISANRTDDSYSFNARLSRSFLKRGTVAVTYQYGENSSTALGYGYNSSQIGFEVGFSY